MNRQELEKIMNEIGVELRENGGNRITGAVLRGLLGNIAERLWPLVVELEADTGRGDEGPASDEGVQETDSTTGPEAGAAEE